MFLRTLERPAWQGPSRTISERGLSVSFRSCQAQAIPRKLPVVRKVPPRRKKQPRPQRHEDPRTVLRKSPDNKLQTHTLRHSCTEFSEYVPQSNPAIRLRINLNIRQARTSFTIKND